jgi:hypothetical protein
VAVGRRGALVDRDFISVLCAWILQRFIEVKPPRPQRQENTPRSAELPVVVVKHFAVIKHIAHCRPLADARRHGEVF